MNKNQALLKIKELEFELSESRKECKYIKGEHERLKSAYQNSKVLIKKMEQEYQDLKD